MMRHAPCCLCRACEQADEGDFAIRAYALGDCSALSRMSARMAHALPALVEAANQDQRAPREVER